MIRVFRSNLLVLTLCFSVVSCGVKSFGDRLPRTKTEKTNANYKAINSGAADDGDDTNDQGQTKIYTTNSAKPEARDNLTFANSDPSASFAIFAKADANPPFASNNAAQSISTNKAISNFTIDDTVTIKYEASAGILRSFIQYGTGRVDILMRIYSGNTLIRKSEFITRYDLEADDGAVTVMKNGKKVGTTDRTDDGSYIEFLTGPAKSFTLTPVQAASGAFKPTTFRFELELNVATSTKVTDEKVVKRSFIDAQVSLD